MMKKLGKLKPKYDKRTLLLAKYLLKELPAPPPSVDWSLKVASSLGAMLNAGDGAVGDCTIAAAGHIVQELTANAGNMIIIPDDAILAAYEAVSGFDPNNPDSDQGACALDVLNYWRQTGIGGHQIGAFVGLEPDNILHVQNAILLFEACYIGLALPLYAENQDVWSIPPVPPTDGSDQPWGGHAVPIVGYDPQGLTVITWGVLKRMTYQFYQQFCDEAYAILSRDMLDSAGLSPAGLDLTMLQNDLSLVSN
jgi:hypothetical protein